MQTATTVLDRPVSADHPLRHRVDMIRRVGAFNSLADATARAALVICGLYTKHGAGGRGPEIYDDVGMVLAALNAATDMASIETTGVISARALPDLGTEVRIKAQRVNHIAFLLEQCGMQQVVARPAEVLRFAQPGDVLTFNGRFECGVCIEGPRERGRDEPVDVRCNDSFPLLGVTYPDQRPFATRGLFMTTTPARLYRWPGAKAAGSR